MNIEIQCPRCKRWHKVSAINLTWYRCVHCGMKIDVGRAIKRTIKEDKEETYPNGVPVLPTHKRRSTRPEWRSPDDMVRCDNCNDPINESAHHVKSTWRGRELIFCSNQCRHDFARRLMNAGK